MAYYSKKEVLEYAQAENKKAEERGITPLTPIEQTISQLDNEEDIAGFFWINTTEGEKLQMNSRAFVRIDHDLYTDDRFALDLYQAQNEGKTVSDVIKERLENKEDAQGEINSREEVEQKIKDTIKKKKEE
jgi:predicted CopG family antitoxin